MKMLILLLTICLTLLSCNEEQGVVSELKKCDSSKDPNCKTPGNLENDVIIRVEGEEESSTQGQKTKSSEISTCENGYIKVSDFCVMRGEAVQANRYKINTNTIEDAQVICKKLGKRLINNKQWSEVAKRIQEHKLNYEIGSKKDFLYSRELFVGKGIAIVDFVSAQPEWVAWSDTSTYLPSECASLSGSAALANCQGVSLGSPILPGDVFSGKISDNDKVLFYVSLQTHF